MQLIKSFEKKKEGLCAKATRGIFADRRCGIGAQGRGAEGRHPWRIITGTAEKKTVSGRLREVEQAATRVFFISSAGGKIPNRAQWTVHWAMKCPAEISGFVFRREEGDVESQFFSEAYRRDLRRMNGAFSASFADKFWQISEEIRENA
ncbi:hypothetical protein U1Q18_015123 [Sarracenia purpurea var. burkii]